MQRVSAIRGDFPAIVVVPHGYQNDDYNTSIVGEQIIHELDCYGVINYGWQRADKYDYYKDHANCNSIAHIKEDVVRQEFHDPIINFAQKIWNEGYIPNIYIIHGFNKSFSTDYAVDVILGVGNGDPPTWSCNSWVALSFASLLDTNGYGVCFGKSGGSYAGRNSDNINQLFASYLLRTQSIQIEIAREFRHTSDKAKMTGNDLAICIEDNVTRQQDWKKWSNYDFFKDWQKI